MSIRVYALAREHNVPSKKVMDLCGSLGIEVKSHMSVISQGDAARVVQALKSPAARSAVSLPAEAPAGKTPVVTEAIRREDYVPASGITSKAPELTGMAKSAAGVEKAKEKKLSGGSPGLKPKSRPLPKMQTTAPVVRKPIVRPKPKAPPRKAPKAQQPDMRLSPEVLRGALKDRSAAPPALPESKPAPAKAPSRAKPRPQLEPKAPKRKSKAKPPAEREDEERRAPTHRPGAVAGREERQKMRGRRAEERRQATRDADLIDGDTDDEGPSTTRTSRIRRAMRGAGGQTTTV